MPMNPRLLRPKASFDAAAQVYFNAVAVADGQQLEPAVKRAINNFITGCKGDGIWTAIKASCLLMGARTLSGALTPLVGTAPTNNNFVSGDYNRKTGLVGNGSTKSLDTGRANNSDGQNDQHLSVWIAEAATQACAYIGASTAASSGSSAIGLSATAINTRSRHAGTPAADSVASVGATGFFGVSRNSSNSYARRIAGLSDTVSVASETPTSANVFVYVTGGGSAFSNGRCAFYSVGAALTLTSLESRLSTLYTAIGAAIP